MSLPEIFLLDFRFIFLICFFTDLWCEFMLCSFFFCLFVTQFISFSCRLSLIFCITWTYLSPSFGILGSSGILKLAQDCGEFCSYVEYFIFFVLSLIWLILLCPTIMLIDSAMLGVCSLRWLEIYFDQGVQQSIPYFECEVGFLKGFWPFRVENACSCRVNISFP